MSKTTYALSTNEKRAELKAMDECHEILRGLSTNQRQRVLNWLDCWLRSEDSD